MCIDNKSGCFSQLKIAFFISILALCNGCGGDNKEAVLDEPQDYIGSWFSNCGERENFGYFANELVLTNNDLEIIEHKYDTSDCTGAAIQSASQAKLSYTYPDSNSDTNDKFIVVELFKDPRFYMTIYFEIYNDLLYLSHNLFINHEGFAFDSSQTSAINYVNYLTKQ